MFSACKPGTSTIFSFFVLVLPKALVPWLEARGSAWCSLDFTDHGVIVACLNTPDTCCSWVQRCIRAQHCCWLKSSMLLSNRYSNHAIQCRFT